ncbi:MAG: amidohydrolase family protein [Pacificimonas sp.]
MKTSLLAAALLASTASVAAAQTEEYRVIAPGGIDIGAIEVTRDGGAVAIDFDYKQNGRGPTIEESLTLNEDGMPTAWAISGRTTFGNPVDERYACVDGRPTWQDSTGPGSGDTCGFYIPQNGSPWGLALLAKALLADEDGALDVVPGGTARITKKETFAYDGADGPTNATTYEISGLDMMPFEIILDDDNELFGVASPRFAMVRKGYESNEEALRDYATTLSTERFVNIQATTARNYEGPVRIRNVRIFDAKGGALTAAKDVVVSGDRIASIQPANSPTTEGETVIDGAGGTLVPGMYEMHGHIGQSNALLNLAAGVTSVRDMGNEHDVLSGLIERIEDGIIAGPRITPSGFIEGQSDFSAATGEIASTEEEAIDLVRFYAARGYPQVKLYNSMNPAWAEAVVDEAHGLGMRVAGHVPAFSTADAMLDAGFDEITHINQLMLGWVIEPDEDTRTLFRFTAMRRFPALELDGDQVQSTLNKMAANDVAHDPTIAIHELGLTAIDGEAPAGWAPVIDNLPVNTQRQLKQALFGTDTQQERDEYIAAFEQVMATLKAMEDKDILLLPGTDLGGSFAYHRELELFQQLGLSPAEVLRRATWQMADYLGQGEDLGTIERGKYADMFLVPGDPTQDLSEIRRIQMVVADGTVYFPGEVYDAFGVKPFAETPEVIEAEAAAE